MSRQAKIVGYPGLALAVLAGLFNSSLWLEAQAPQKHPVALSDLVTSKMAENLDLSPDGQVVAYSVDGVAPTQRGDVWIASTSSGVGPRKVAQGTVPRWSPDGKRLAYYAGPPGDFQLWVFEPDSGRTERLTHIKEGIDPDPQTRVVGWAADALALGWSPDGTKLLFVSQVAVEDKNGPVAAQYNGEKPEHAPLVLTRGTPPEWTLSGIYSRAFGSAAGWAHWENKGDSDPNARAVLPPVRVNQLFVVDVKTKHLEQLTTDSANYFSPDWSPDGTKVVCASGKIPTALASAKTNLYVIDLVSHQKTPLTSGPEVKWRGTWSPDGNWVAYLSGAFSGRQHLFVVPSSGGRPRRLTAALDRYVYEFRWSPNSRSIHALIKSGVSIPVVEIDLQSARVRQLTNDYASRSHLAASRDGSLSWQQSDGTSDNVIWVAVRGKAPVPTVDLNPHLKTWELGSQEVIHWKNSRGEEIEGVLLKPVGYQRGRRYPLIVDCYPGTSNTFRSQPYGGNQAWASRGYAVLFTSGARAPHVWMNPFKSLSYDQAAKGAHGWNVTFDDVMSGVDEVIRLGVADPNRMGLFGFSNGGAIVHQMITRTNRFKCAVAHAGVAMADLTRSFLSTPTFDWSSLVGVTPWQDPAGYVALSAVYRLDRVTTPVLLADGDDDGEFLLNNVELYDGLRYLAKDVTFVRYAGQSHVLTGWALQDFLQRTMAFFDAHLKPKEGGRNDVIRGSH